MSSEALKGLFVVDFCRGSLEVAVPIGLKKFCRPATAAQMLDQLGTVKFVVPNLNAPTRSAKVRMSSLGLQQEVMRVDSARVPLRTPGAT